MTVSQAGREPAPIQPVPAAVRPPTVPAVAPGSAPEAPSLPPIQDLVRWRTPGIQLMPSAQTLLALVDTPPAPQAPPPVPALSRPETPLPAPIRHLAATGDESDVAIATKLDAAGRVRASLHVTSDGTGTAEAGALTLEEAKTTYLTADDVAGTGVAVAVDRASSVSLTPAATDSTATARHDEYLGLRRRLALFGPRPDTTLQADYRLGVTPTRFGPAAAGAWLDQAVSVGMQTEPMPGVTLGVGTDLPLGVGLGGRNDLAVTASVAVPYLRVGTAQTPDTAHYDAHLQGAAWGVVALSAGGAVDQDKATGATAVSGQVLLKLQL